MESHEVRACGWWLWALQRAGTTEPVPDWLGAGWGRWQGSSELSWGDRVSRSSAWLQPFLHSLFANAPITTPRLKLFPGSRKKKLRLGQIQAMAQSLRGGGGRGKCFSYSSLAPDGDCSRCGV